MILFPNAKINLGLNVVRRRADGYHEIESVMVPIPLNDILEAVLDPDLDPGQVLFSRSGIPVPGSPVEDLCWKAVEILREGRVLPGIRLHLHKVIPMGAGLGGGSSDGAHTLLLLNDLLQLGLERDELLGLAMRLGSDCPFFLDNVTQLARGRGELLSPIKVELSGWWVLLVNPGAHISTAEVYSKCLPSGNEAGLATLLTSHPVAEWPGLVSNALAPPVMTAYPVVGDALETLRLAGAAFSTMSGSGSTVFGLFRERPTTLSWPEGHKVWSFQL